MPKIEMFILKAFLLQFLLISSSSFANSFHEEFQDTLAIIHHIEVPHPGKTDDYPLVEQLVEVQTKDGRTQYFSMEVKSVICGDGRCKRIEILLFWDILGNYADYEIVGEGILEKGKEGIPFTEDDYKKLDQIICLKDSPFKNLLRSELLLTDHDTEFVDGVAGATRALSEDAYIIGAVWTCYTLWHYVNGRVPMKIRKITEENLSNKDILELLDHEDQRYSLFALEQMTTRSMYDNSSLNKILERTQELDGEGRRLTLKYLEAATPDLYIASILELLTELSDQQRIPFLISMKNINYEIPGPSLDKLSQELCTLISYTEITVKLEILEKHRATSSVVIDNVLCLLDHSDLFVARAAYWYLNGQQLSDNQKEKLESFFAEHKEMF